MPSGGSPATRQKYAPACKAKCVRQGAAGARQTDAARVPEYLVRPTRARAAHARAQAVLSGSFRDANMKTLSKFLTEVALLQATDGVVLLKPADLYRTADMVTEQLRQLDSYHIYFVCQRPRIRILHAHRQEAASIALTLVIATHSAETEKTVRLLIPPDLPIANLLPEKNGANYRFELLDGSETGEYSIDHLLPLIPKGIAELSDLEVVYIGQALGTQGNRSAFDRLLAHSTLQRVLAEQAQVAWWMESVLVLFSYPDNPRLISLTNGWQKPLITGEANWAHFSSIQANPLSQAQLVTIAEASLIRYFQPPYNKHYVGEYPTSKRKHLADAYRLDYNALVTEIDTKDVRVTIRSAAVPATDHHIARFDLHDSQDRRSFFALPTK